LTKAGTRLLDVSSNATKAANRAAPVSIIDPSEKGVPIKKSGD
jgi:hypothetical protein